METGTDKESVPNEAADQPAPESAAVPPPPRCMKGARIRLALAAAAFLIWIGYLAYLAFVVNEPMVVSRAQLLQSDLDVVVEIEAAADGSPSPQVVVKEVIWSGAGKPASDSITVIDLPRASGWDQPGLYLVPLVKRGEAYSIAPVALSPGYNGRELIRIYPARPKIIEQVRAYRARINP